MRNFRVLVVLFVVAILIFSRYSIAQAADMSNTEFADAIVKAMGLEMPEGSENLSAAERYEIQVNMLTERGIDVFSSSNSSSTVTKGDLCKVLQTLNDQVTQATNTSPGRGDVTSPFYDPITGYSATPPAESVDFLAKFGCTNESESKETVSAEEVIQALSNPAYTRAVAEAYSDPDGIGRPALTVPPQNPKPEDDPGLFSETEASPV